MCADFSTELNDSLVEHNYRSPNPEVFSNLNGRKIFQKLDLPEAYLKLLVDENCTHHLTINTYRGLCKFKWLLFVTKVVSAIFEQVVIDTMLNGCEFTERDRRSDPS